MAGVISSTVLYRGWAWYLTFGLEQVSFAVLNGESDEVVVQKCAVAAAWLERTASLRSPLGLS